MSTTIDFQIDNDGIAVVTIDVQNKPMNVLTPELIGDLRRYIGEIADNDAVKGVIVTSGKADFMAGADLNELPTIYDRNLSGQDIYRYCRPYSECLRTMESCGKPFAAAINGVALGGGLELVLACHYRVLADDPNIKLGLPEVTLGLLPGAGGTQRLPRLIGIEKALPLLLEGRQLNAAAAKDLGIVDELATPESLLARARDWLLHHADPEQPWDKKGFKIPGGSGVLHPKMMQTFMVGNALVAAKSFHNYPAPIAIMSCVYEGTIVPMDAALRIETRYFASLLRGPVARNMMRTLFINKGKADKLARRPDTIPKGNVQKLGVLGAGMMGAGIAYVSARAGMEVVLLDVSSENAEKGKDYSRNLTGKNVERGKMSKQQADRLLERIKPVADVDEIAGCDLVVEAVFEDRTIKADITHRVEAVIAEDIVFASNTSTLPITGLAQQSSRPANFIGLHFFSPVDKMPLVEVIIGERTSQRTIALAMDYVSRIGKTPVLVNDSRGFFTSRVFGTFPNEGQAMLLEGINPALIENAAKLAGMPVGPLVVSDEVSIELQYKVIKQTREDLGGEWQPPSANEVIYRFIEDFDRPGKRAGKGFYEYPPGGQKYLWPELGRYFPLAAEQPDVELVKKRLLYIQALEAARCMEEGIITDAGEADVASILGWGFPAYTGGVLSLIDTIGLGTFIVECDELAQLFGSRFLPSAWLRDRAAQNRNFHAASIELPKKLSA